MQRADSNKSALRLTVWIHKRRQHYVYIKGDKQQYVYIKWITLHCFVKPVDQYILSQQECFVFAFPSRWLSCLPTRQQVWFSPHLPSLLECSNMGDLASSYATVGIAHGLIRTSKPHYNFKVETTESNNRHENIQP